MRFVIVPFLRLLIFLLSVFIRDIVVNFGRSHIHLLSAQFLSVGAL